jgi:hypothetical protein
VNLPRVEIDTLLMTVTDAVDRAMEGDPAGGYEALLAGLRRAEEIRDEGAEYGAELVTRWQDALDRFAERYRIGRA